MITSANVNDIIGATVHGRDDDKIGTVGQVYLDDGTQEPVWATVKTGLFGTSESFVPLKDASFDGDIVVVGYDKGVVKDAPHVDADGQLSAAEQDSLYLYYGLDSGAGAGDAAGGALYDQDADAGVPAGGAEGHDTSGPTTDDAMTRSEERLHVGTERVETGRARLRKHIVTENVTQTVPVSHEEVTVTREPITEANAGDALSGPELSEEEHEVVLTGERVVTEKETVPVERVRLGTETVTEQQQVSAEVAHEEIDIVEPDGTTSSR